MTSRATELAIVFGAPDCCAISLYGRGRWYAVRLSSARSLIRMTSNRFVNQNSISFITKLLFQPQISRIRTGHQTPSNFDSLVNDVKVVRGSQVCAGTVGPSRRDNPNSVIK